MRERKEPSEPAEWDPKAVADEPIWESYYREVSHFGQSNIDVFFLAFLRRVERFGYFTLGPITVDVRLIEDIVENTTIPTGDAAPPFGEQMTRFSHLLAEEVQRLGRKRIDDLAALLALMKFNEGLPGRVFGELGVSASQVEEYVRGGEMVQRPAEKLYSPEEAAEYLGVHVQTVRGWIRSGRLKASRLAGQRALRIKAHDLQSVLEPLEAADVD